MGIAHQFRCSGCGYEVVACGGVEHGFMAVVQTMTCLTCRELVDVLLGREGIDGKVGPSGDPEFDRGIGLCPECAGTQLASWKNPGPCPPCGEALDNVGPSLLWD